MAGKVYFVIFLGLLVNAVVTSIYHKQKKLNIYYDFTDAILTIGALLSPFIVGLISGYLINGTVGTILGWITFLGGLLFVYRSSHVNNSSIQYAIMSAFTKYLVVGVYIILMVMQGGKPTKREHESDVAYEIRAHNQAVGDAIRSAVLTALFTWFTYSMTRVQQFGELGQYFVFDFNRKPLSVMFDNCEEGEDIADDEKLLESYNCTNCGSNLPATVKFCNECGSKLLEA